MTETPASTDEDQGRHGKYGRASFFVDKGREFKV